MSEQSANSTIDAVKVIYYSASTNGFYDQDINSKIPNDAVEISVAEWQSLLQGQSNGGLIEPDDAGYPVLRNQPTPSLEATYTYLEAAVQLYLDEGAQKWGYVNMVTACSYISSTNNQYAADAGALIGWRDAVWEWAYIRYQTVVAGEAVEDFIDGVPVQPSKPVI